MSILGIIFMVKNISFEHIQREIMPRLPKKIIFATIAFLASYFLILWLIKDIGVLIRGKVHPDVKIYTTAAVNMVDLSIFVTLSASTLLLMGKKKPPGYVLGLMIILMVPQTMIALSIWTFINIYYQNLGLKSLEFPLIIFAGILYSEKKTKE